MDTVRSIRWLDWVRGRRSGWLYIGVPSSLCIFLQLWHGQDKTVLSWPCRRCEHNWRQDKTVLVVLNTFETEELEIGNWVETRQTSVHTAFRDRAKLSCLVASSVHTADTDKTRQSCLVLSVSAVWTRLQSAFASSCVQTCVAWVRTWTSGLTWVHIFEGLDLELNDVEFDLD